MLIFTPLNWEMQGKTQNQALQLEDYQKKIAVLNKNIAIFKKILIAVAVVMLVIFLL